MFVYAPSLFHLTVCIHYRELLVSCWEQADNRDAYEEALEDLKTVVLEEVRQQ